MNYSIIIIKILTESWWIGLWSCLNTLAILTTLFFIIKYTKSTKEMASATYDMAKSQSEEVGLRKKPVIVINCLDSKIFYFTTYVKNFSLVHAKIRVMASIYINDKLLKIKPENHYSGKRIWHVQAMGQTEHHIAGHLDFKNVFIMNNLTCDPKNVKAEVILESWAINFYDNDNLLNDDFSKNPIVKFYWDTKHQIWIPEVAPIG